MDTLNTSLLPWLNFARALRTAGLKVDASRMALAIEALTQVGVNQAEDVRFALQAVFTGSPADRAVLNVVFEAYFKISARAPDGLPLNADDVRHGTALGHRLRQALAEIELELRCDLEAPPQDQASPDEPAEPDRLALQASALQRLRQADFRMLSADETRQVEGMVRSLRVPLPRVLSRRTRTSHRGARLDWAKTLQTATRHDGEVLNPARRARRAKPLPLLILVDISGSMAVYARWLLAFLHPATQGVPRQVFAFGTELSDLNRAFALADTDAMLRAVNHTVTDYGGGTRLGHALEQLARQHPRAVVGRRTVVLLITDGLDTGPPPVLQAALHSLKRHSRRILWLNPLLRFEGYAPLAQGPQILSRCCDAALPMHNLNSLSALSHAVAQALQTP